jgi:hypothetical protein
VVCCLLFFERPSSGLPIFDLIAILKNLCYDGFVCSCCCCCLLFSCHLLNVLLLLLNTGCQRFKRACESKCSGQMNMLRVMFPPIHLHTHIPFAQGFL